MTDDKESFLQRWSRRKGDEREPTAVPVAEPPPALPAQTETPAAKADATEGNDESLDLSKLPPIESLTKESDFSVFMQQGVPADLRAQALRRLWATPEMAAPDLLDMHMWDYTGNDGIKPLLQPVLQVLAETAKKALDDRQHESKAEPSAKTSADQPTSEVDHAAGGDSAPADAADGLGPKSKT
jgi:hypothetical protein